jgi:hypothetical protein
MDSSHRSPVKDQLVETVLFDFPAEARKRIIGGRRSQPRDLGGDLRRDHDLRDDNDRLGWGRRQAQNGGSPDGGPMVRVLLPPAVSQTNFRAWLADRSAPPDRARHYIDDVRELGKEPPYADGPKLQHERGR